MKILFVCPYPPYPVISGGHTRVFNLIKQLSSRHRICLLAYNRDPVSEEQRHVLEKYCARVRFIQRAPVWSPGNLARYVFSRDPFMHVINGRDGRVTAAVEEEIRSFSPELIHVEHFHMAQAVLRAGEAKPLPKVISEQGVEYLILERMAGVRRNPIHKLAAWLEARRIRPFEVNICNQFESCIEVSQEDKLIIEHAGVRIPVGVAINGVDAEYFSPRPGLAEEEALVFVGTFKFFGNVDGIRWLLDRVWPRVRELHQGLRLYVVGNSPPGWLCQHGDPNIVVTGWVPDIRDYILKSRLVIAPLRMGSGTKLKILEAMSMAKPVVTTQVGAEGIGAEEGKHLVVRDDPAQMAEAVNRLLKEQGMAQEIGRQARQFILDNYSWEKAANQVSEIYQEVIKSGKGLKG
jgi:glycosyltransferase involved in cell wall biosynthesis